jgi:hypothetical protein
MQCECGKPATQTFNLWDHIKRRREDVAACDSCAEMDGLAHMEAKQRGICAFCKESWLVSAWRDECYYCGKEG